MSSGGNLLPRGWRCYRLLSCRALACSLWAPRGSWLSIGLSLCRPLTLLYRSRTWPTSFSNRLFRLLSRNLFQHRSPCLLKWSFLHRLLVLLHSHCFLCFNLSPFLLREPHHPRLCLIWLLLESLQKLLHFFVLHSSLLLHHCFKRKHNLVWISPIVISFQSLQLRVFLLDYLLDLSLTFSRCFLHLAHHSFDRGGLALLDLSDLLFHLFVDFRIGLLMDYLLSDCFGYFVSFGRYTFHWGAFLWCSVSWSHHYVLCAVITSEWIVIESFLSALWSALTSLMCTTLSQNTWVRSWSSHLKIKCRFSTLLELIKHLHVFVFLDLTAV